MPVLNGRLDAALLSPVPGGQLRRDAAASWIRLVAAVKATSRYVLAPTSYVDTYRPYSVQERIFTERYTDQFVTGIDPRLWRGVTWWRLPGQAAAAIPGTSNHGLGVAVDIASMGAPGGTKYRAVAAVAPAHGWDNVEGASIGEPWHWVYKPANDQHNAPAPEAPQEVDVTLDGEDIREINGVVYRLWREPEIAKIIAAAAAKGVADAAGAAVWGHLLRKGDAPAVPADVWLVDTRMAVAGITAPGATAAITDADLERIAKAVADEQARRLAG